MEYDDGDRSLNRIPQQILNLIDISTSSSFYILNYSESLDMIKEANKLESVIGVIYPYHLGSKE